MAESHVEPPGFFPPPPGVETNFVNPEQNLAGLVPLICVFVPLSTIFLALRVYTKARIIRVFGWEDVAIILGWLFTITFMGFLLIGMKLGNGKHMWNVTLHDFLKFAKTLAAGVIIYVWAVGLPKVAILLFYLRVNPTRSFRYACSTVIFITFAYMFALTFALLFPCRPINKLWEPFIEGKCIDQNPIYLANVIINTIVDVLVLLLPIPMLIKLQVNTRTKILLFSIFSFCSVTVLISAVRIWATATILGDEDFTWNTAISDALAVCELNLTIVCGSVLTLRPFCRRHLPFLIGLRRSRPTDGPPNGPNGVLNFDGPSGPKSKSGYLTKVSGGRNGAFTPGSKRSGGKHRLWSGFGTTLTKDNEYEDLESLSAELRTIAPGVRMDDTKGNKHASRKASKGSIDAVKSENP